MIPKECKRLAEVDFPIAVVGMHSAREKPIVRRHPQAFHQWWARRPLAACRAMLLALLLPDPSDEHCPTEFKAQARTLLGRHAGKIGRADTDLREALLRFIGDFANWDNAAHPIFLAIGRGLVKAAHPDETPLVVDPFAGGGSIPLEALRLGCDAFASDLNPVACLILKVLLEDIPRHGPELADELRKVGAEVKKAAEHELAEFYPRDPDGARPIAYLWARTVRCEAPHCGAEIPLLRSFWLCKKPNRKRALRTKVMRPARSAPVVEFDVFEPLTDKDVRTGTVSRAKATCLCCNTVLAPDRVRAQLAAQRGGADLVFEGKGRRAGGARLLAVVTLRDDNTGRHYRVATHADYRAVWKSQQRLRQVMTAKRSHRLSLIPDEPTPAGGGSGAGRAFSVQRYGMMRWGDLFTARQAVFLTTLNRACEGALNVAKADDSVAPLLAFVVSRSADRLAHLVGWDTNGEKIDHVFKRQALPMTWDFAEGVPFADASGSLDGIIEQIAGAAEDWAAVRPRVGQAQLADAAAHPLPSESAAVWFTDPPYYDAVPYADLADFFLVWLKRALPSTALPSTALPSDPFDSANPLSPKEREAVQDETKFFEGRPKDRAVFEEIMAKAFARGAQILDPARGVGAVVFAHKTTEGWEALLGAMIRGGWVITASWPISTERPNRLRARESAALATSIHLVCRPRPQDAPVGDWGQVLRELPKRVADWMNRLQDEGIRGADLVFACIGPALEIYSRYAKVVDAEEREIPLGGDPEAREPHKRGYLAYVWEVVGRAALEQVLGTAEARARNGAAGALEEDARLTALFLWTLQATTQESAPAAGEAEAADDDGPDDEDDAPARRTKKGLTLPFDVARRFAQPLGIHLDAWEGRCIETDKGIVRLIPVAERARQLFGEDGAEAVADRLERHRGGPVQASLFPETEPPPTPPLRGRRRRGAEVPDESLRRPRGATTLDHVHAAMLLQASGRANALRALIKSEIDRGPDFLRLANALSALYPPGGDEKRLLDAMLLAVPR